MDEKNKKADLVLGIMGIIFTLFFLYVFIMYFKYVSIGEWIAQENYSDKGEWFKQLGLFIATMSGFYVMMTFLSSLLEYLPESFKILPQIRLRQI